VQPSAVHERDYNHREQIGPRAAIRLSRSSLGTSFAHSLIFLDLVALLRERFIPLPAAAATATTY
jgi:hypothetical protein